MLSGPSAETKRAFAIFFVVFLWPKSNDDDDGSMLINNGPNHVIIYILLDDKLKLAGCFQLKAKNVTFLNIL